jgi:hypothetical protein
MKQKISFNDLKDEIDQIRHNYPKLKDDSAFVLWFLRAFLAESEDAAIKALTGGTGDKGVDAVLIDHEVKQVHVVQGKFHQSLGEHLEKHGDVIAFAELASLPWESKDVLTAFYHKLDSAVHQRFQEMIKLIQQNNYEMRLYYVTTGRCSDTIRNEAKARVRQAKVHAEITIFDGAQVMTIFKDYLEGVAPAVPTLSLRIAFEGSIRTDGVIHRFDPEKGIESWVFSMSAKDVGEMYAKAGIRLFARNIRGYLGQANEINEAMASTIKKEPHNFWYYNNGVTIVCDEAVRETQGGQDVLRVERPQVINGQQTTRTLHNNPSDRASLLVRVIKIPRRPGDEDDYDDLVSSIVRATNWQNAIKPSDLVSNDHIQVFLERELRKRGYQYLRKRQTKSEARRLYGSNYWHIKKDELAQAVAACEFDPVVVRKGKEGLFEERYYRSIFRSRSLSSYLSKYWLMQQVRRAAKGYPERAYAKWLTLHFAWQQLARDIGSGTGAQRFRSACERSEDKVLRPLQKALDGVFRAALAFYRSERGRGEEAKDVSTFFMLGKLHEKFETFWQSSKNSQAKAVNRRLEEFRSALNNMELAE